MNETKTKTIRLLVVEPEEIYRYLYQIVPLGNHIELLDVSADLDTTAIKDAIRTSHPDVLLIGINKTNNHVIEVLDKIREDQPGLGIVLVILSYNSGDIDMLRKFAVKNEGGLAVFLRQSLVQVDQLVGIIQAASYGQFLLDPFLASFMFSGKRECPFLEQLTAREMEILNLLSGGYNNLSIAKTLFIDVKTVEHHLNSIYSKLRAESDVDQRHLRVAATRIYLEETGALVS